MARKPTLVDAVVEACRQQPSRKLIDHLPDDIRQELAEIRSAWISGKLSDQPQTKTGLAKIVARQLRLRGVVISQHTVSRWLEDEND
jgi:hypothetical protein